MGWLSGWNYAQQINLTAGAVNYPVALFVGESSGSTGAQFNANGHSANFPNDLRFTSANGTTLLNYYVEAIVGTAPNRVAKIWVQQIDTSGVMICYYGNSAATSASSGKNTFLFFDDFSVQDTKWLNTGDSGTLTWTTLNSKPVVYINNTAVAGGSSVKFVYNQSIPIGTGLISEASFYATGGDLAAGLAIGTSLGTAYCSGWYGLDVLGWGNTYCVEAYNNSGDGIKVAKTFTTSYWYRIQNIQTSSGVSSKVYDDSNILSPSLFVSNSWSGTVSTTSFYPTVSAYNYGYFGYFRVYPYTNPAPAFSSAGSELTPPPAPTGGNTGNFFLFF